MPAIPRNIWMGLLHHLAVPTILATSLVAQTSRPQNSGPPPQWQPEGILRIPSYSTDFSWPLFAACDQDADDRLDLLEAQSCIIMLDDSDARAAFRRMDRNADGFLYWPEFDEVYRHAITDGDGLYLHPSRAALLDDLPGLQPKRDRQSLSATDVMENFDTDGDSALGSSEISTLLQSYGLKPQLASRIQALDIDASGAIDVSELATILQFIRLPRTKPVKLAPESKSTLRFEFDADYDGFVEVNELEDALLLLAPTLIPWAGTIIQGADRDGDQRLNTKEIQQAFVL